MIPDLRRDTGSLSGNRNIGNVRVFRIQCAMSDPFVDEESAAKYMRYSCRSAQCQAAFLRAAAERERKESE